MNTTTLRVGDYNETSTTNSVLKFYNYVFWEASDPRTRDWFLLASPIPGAALLGAYLYFVLSWGPRQMAQRKPFVLNKTLVFYNFVQVVLSCYIFWEGLDAGWLRDYSWKCEPVDFSNNPKALRVARGVYMYFLAKLTELLDTVFFVLRKKDRQITFLHLYHHTVMPMVSWGASKYYPGGHGTFIGVINSFVHIIMYTYYMLSAVGPEMQKYLWWKKYITTLQMGQFCLAFLHSLQLLWQDCEYPRWSLIFILPNAMFFYFLFSEFYNKAYQDEQNAKKKKKKDDDADENEKDDDDDAVAACKSKNQLQTNGKPCNGSTANGKATGQSNGNCNGKPIANGKSKPLQNGKPKLA